MRIGLCFVGLLGLSVLPVSVANAQSANSDVGKQFSDARLVEIGNEVYHSSGTNTCQECHGATGEHGIRPQAANLTQPETWRSYRALNGDWSKMDVSLRYLIEYGAMKWNSHFEKEHPDIKYDWPKAKTTKYNTLMYGETQPAMRSSMAQIKDQIATKDKVQLTDEQMRDLGAEAALRYVKTFSKP